ncbi:hypothetical protein [Nakamurella lactea]|uniref:hypothetical protein n=1 Tax=Nakamurella lactea TaxID=459515 RepID=UPI00041F50D7|nr:hypothetical protein [Nakamurella lactea]
MPARSVLTLTGAIVAAVVGFSVTTVSAAAPPPTLPPGPQTVSAVPLAAPGNQPSHEDVYVPITPCRIVDTRKAVGKFNSTTTRNYYVTGTFGFAPQGGKTGGCGIPKGATAIAATLTAITPTHAGYFRAWPNGLAEPGATLLNYSTVNIGTGANVSLSTTAGQPLRVKNYGGPSHLVIDVSGYYVKQLGVLITFDGSLYSGSSRAISSSRLGVGVYLVQFDRDVKYCSATASVYVADQYASTTTYYGSSSDTVQIRVFNAAAVPADQSFYLNVLC